MAPLTRKRSAARTAAPPTASERARQKASQVVPRAKTAGSAVVQGAGQVAARARPGVHRARAWAAPHVDRTGQVVQERIAPQVSDMLSKAAKRLDPAPQKPQKPRRSRLARGITLLTAAASASAVIALLRRQRQSAGTGGVSQTAADAMPGDGEQAGPAADDANADVNGQVRAG
jgi:hypothetical protein